MPNPICRHEGAQVLLVEGTDDCHVVLALRAAHQVAGNFGLYECGGDEQLLKRLNALVVQPDPPSVIGLVLDADTGPDNRWASVLGKMSEHEYEFPPHPNANGTIIEPNGGLPKLGVWLMPNNQIQGMLEDFCLEMIEPARHAVAEAAVATAQQQGAATFIANHRSKAIVHTFLAWQDPPGRPLGQGITAQSLRPETPTARALVQWLTTLFG